MEVKAGYKETEVGIIPTDWDVKKLGELVSLRTGPFGSSVHKSDYVNGGIAFINPTHIFNGELLPDPNVTVSPETVARLSEFQLRTNDIIMGRRGEMGRCAVVQEGQQGWLCGSGSMILRPNSKIVPEFLQRVISSPLVIGKIEETSVGSTMINLNQAVVNGLLITYPPLPEQEAIAEALSDADALIEALEQLIAKKRQVKQGAMQELLTGKRRLPRFTGKWKEKKIEEIAFPSSEKNNEAKDLPVLTCSKHLGFVNSLSYFKNQVFSDDTSSYRFIRRGQIGYPANHVEEGSIGLQDLYDVAIVSPIYVVFSVNEEVNSYFLHRLLKLDAYRQKFATETNASVDRRGSLRWNAFSQITVNLPSIEEQTAIAEILSDMDAEIAALEGKLSKAREVKQGMMQELLTGRVRLV